MKIKNKKALKPVVKHSKHSSVKHINDSKPCFSNLYLSKLENWSREQGKASKQHHTKAVEKRESGIGYTVY